MNVRNADKIATVFVRVLMLLTDNIRKVRTVKMWQVVANANAVSYSVVRFAL